MRETLDIGIIPVTSLSLVFMQRESRSQTPTFRKKLLGAADSNPLSWCKEQAGCKEGFRAFQNFVRAPPGFRCKSSLPGLFGVVFALSRALGAGDQDVHLGEHELDFRRREPKLRRRVLAVPTWLK